jgi:hypothetical protein
VNDDATKVEMMVRLNTLQSHFVYVVASKNIGKLKRNIKTGRREDEYLHSSNS